MLYAYLVCSQSRNVIEEHRLGLLRTLQADIRQATDPVERCMYWVDRTPYWVDATPLVYASWEEIMEWCTWIRVKCQ